MKIIVVGCGRIGSGLAQSLSQAPKRSAVRRPPSSAGRIRTFAFGMKERMKAKANAEKTSVRARAARC